MIDCYSDIAELIKAECSDWFVSTLQSLLSNICNYDYFLMVEITPGKSINILRSDFLHNDIRLALSHYEQETFQNDPIYRLFSNGMKLKGVYDMSELVKLNHDHVFEQNQKFMVEDRFEELGYRTLNWPKNLQETCIICPVNSDVLIAISLYNTGLGAKKPTDTKNLKIIFPIIHSLINRHYKSNIINKRNNEKLKNTVSINIDSVIQFFKMKINIEITHTEAQVFQHLLMGSSITATSTKLNVSIHTSRTHRRNVYRKIGRGNIVELTHEYHTYIAFLNSAN